MVNLTRVVLSDVTAAEIFVFEQTGNVNVQIRDTIENVPLWTHIGKVE
jgi:hypothetical protein